MSADHLLVVRTPDGRSQRLNHGDLIGRLETAALWINDGRISDCHAYVSVRRNAVHLLGLRGRFRIDGQVVREVELRPGMEIELAPGVRMEVEQVRPPADAQHIWLDGCWIPLMETVSVTPTGLRRGRTPDARAVLWWDGDGWLIEAGERVERVHSQVVLDGESYRFSRRPLEGSTSSHGAPAGLAVIITGSTVRVESASAATRLRGRTARLVVELAAIGAPVGWETMARQLWEVDAETNLRQRWDMLLYRLRRRLQSQGLRPDLIAADGAGLIQLALGPDDRLTRDQPDLDDRR